MSKATLSEIEMNGQAEDTELITDEENVPQYKAPKEFLQQVRKLVEELRSCETDPVKGCDKLLKLREYYYDKKYWHYRQQIGDVLAECGYSTSTYKMFENLQMRGFFPEGLERIKNPSMWKTSRFVLDNAWNYSDASPEFASDLAKSNILELLCRNLKKYEKSPDRKSNIYFIMKATLCIMNNIARRPENKHMFKKYNSVKLVFEFKFSHDNYLKVLALTTLAFIVDAKEAQKLTEDTDTIQTIIHWMNLSIENDDFHRLKEGFTAAELAYALGKLAIDGNAEKIIEGKALKAFFRMLNKADVDQQINAAKCIWSLAFNPDARKQIKIFKELISTLKRLAVEETNKMLIDNVKGALWVLFDKGDSEPLHVDPSKPKHLFISYCWNEKETVRKIWQQLIARGYEVWIDIERMSGDILEAMSSAVENSSIVILCISEGYKQSQCCRTEAGYTYKRKKNFIPLYLQAPYNPDGWLGVLLSTHLYFDFSNDGNVEFEDSMGKLFGELHKMGITDKPSSSTTSPEIPKENKLEKHCSIIEVPKQPPWKENRNIEPTPNLHIESDAALFADSLTSVPIPRRSASPHLNYKNPSVPIQALPSPTILPITTSTTIIARSPNSVLAIPFGEPPESVLRMKKNDVREWLRANELEQSIPNFKHIDGKLLWQLKCMKAEAPSFFYKLLQSELELTAVPILKFRAALENLQ